jgi:Flp pilus assembly pilin Flp
MDVRRMREALRQFGRNVSGVASAHVNESGQDLLEYAMLVSLIVLAAVGAIGTLGGTIKTVFWDAIANAKF